MYTIIIQYFIVYKHIGLQSDYLVVSDTPYITKITIRDYKVDYQGQIVSANPCCTRSTRLVLVIVSANPLY